jgi:hypothetical protein
MKCFSGFGHIYAFKLRNYLFLFNGFDEGSDIQVTAYKNCPVFPVKKPGTTLYSEPK